MTRLRRTPAPPAPPVTPAGWLAGLLGLLLVVAGCGSGDQPAAAPAPTTSATSTSASPTPLPTATAPAQPDDAACYRFTYSEAIAPTIADGRSTSCRQDHTAETYAVGNLDNVVDGHLLAVDSRRVQASVARTCPDLLPDLVGGTESEQRLSLLQSVWFTPTVEESDDGADWYVCDAVVVSGDRELASIDTSLKGALSTTEGRTRYAMCGTAQPGTQGFSTVLCSDASASWRAISVVDFDQPDGAYPGADAAKARGQQTCEDAGRNVATDPLSFRWAYAFPTADDWAAGQTFGRCWAPV